MAQNDEKGQKEPFIGSSERPEVKLDLDMPLTDLRVRDLAAILGHLGSKSPFEAGKTPIKDFFDKPFPEEAKDFLKEIKIEKAEKPEKPEKAEKHEKLEKHEKREKHELKELKVEKVEIDVVFEVDRFPPGPDPRFESVIQTIGQLTRQVAALADQVEQLRKRQQG